MPPKKNNPTRASSPTPYSRTTTSAPIPERHQDNPDKVTRIVYLSAPPHSNSHIYKAKFHDVFVVVKKLPDEEAITNEIKHLSKIKVKGSSPYITYFYTAFPRYNIMLELMDRSLASFIFDLSQPFDWSFRVTVARDVIHALLFLHTLTPAIVHRDIKPANILIKDGRAKLADLGSAIIENEEDEDGYLGTLPYTAPDVGNSSPASDIFSFAIVLVEIIRREFASAKGLFADKSPEDKESFLVRETNDPCSPEYRFMLDIARKNWARDPETRDNAQTIAAIFENNIGKATPPPPAPTIISKNKPL